MIDRHSPTDLDSRINIERQYGGFPAYVKMRFGPYALSDDGRDIHDEIRTALQPESGEVILDVGCADGVMLTKLHEMYPGTKLLGIDIDDFVLTHGEYAIRRLGYAAVAHLERDDQEGQEDIDPKERRKVPYFGINYNDPSLIELLLANVNDMKLPHGSVDTMLVLFTLYHAQYPKLALKHCSEIVKPGGRLIFATSGSCNKIRHRAFEKQITDHLGIQGPPVFAATFNSELAEEMLPTFFTTEKQTPQRSNMVISTEDEMERYLLSLLTMREGCSPVPSYSEWDRAVDELVRPVIRQEIAENGAFIDTIERDWFVCTNDLTHTF